MVPQTDRSIAMTQKKVTVQIGPDDTNLFSSPPIRLERPPVILAQEARYENEAILELNSSAPPNVLYGAFHRIYLFWHNG